MRKVKIGVVGCGVMGMRHLQDLIKHPACGPGHVFAAEKNPATADEIRAEATIPVAGDLDELLQIPDLEAVVIACPNRFHASSAIQALQAGKHVLLEKPMALNEKDARSVVEAARASGKTLHIGFEQRHSLFPMRARQLINDGTIGPPISAQVVHYRGHFWPAWKGKREDGGGMYLMENCHSIDLFRWWSGQEIARIIAVGTKTNVVRHYEYPDTQFSSYIFRNGFVGHTVACHARSAIPVSAEGKLAPYDEMHAERNGHQYEFSLVGQKGSLRFLPTNKVCYVYRHEHRPDGSVWQQLDSTLDYSRFADHGPTIHDTTKELDEFLGAVLEKRDTHIAPEDALKTHLACYAAQKALDGGMPVDL